MDDQVSLFGLNILATQSSGVNPGIFDYINTRLEGLDHADS
jgi:hypothetical protein